MDREIVIWCLLEMCSAKRREIERECEFAEEVVSVGLWGTPATELQKIMKLREIYNLFVVCRAYFLFNPETTVKE